MACRAFVVQQAPIRHRDHAGTRIDRKPAARCIGQTVGLRVTHVGIGTSDGPHHRADGRVLGHTVD